MAFVELIQVSDCRKELGTFVRHGERGLAVFRFDNPLRIFVIDDHCPHAGGSLSSGEVAGGIVTCNWHQWGFDLATGVSTHSPSAQVRRYPAEVRNGMVWVDLGGRESETE